MYLKIVKISARLMSASTKCIRFSSSTAFLNESTKLTTVDNEEVLKHASLASTWWDENGELKALHTMNKLRIPFIRDGLIHCESTNPLLADSSKPLDGTRILDVGCGGGVLSEPLARIGAQVTGIDPGKEQISTAVAHSDGDIAIKSRLTYLCSSIEDHVLEHTELYDAVVASEVLEHVNEKDRFIEACTSVLKPGGSLFVTTINRTMPAWVAGVIAAEHLLNLLPQNTHDWEKFVTPHEVQYMLEKYDCQVRLVHGMFYNFICNEWFWTPNVAINYALHAIKKK